MPLNTLLPLANIHAPPVVPMWQTLLFSALLIAMIVTLALEEKIHAKKSMITSIFAIISLAVATAMGLMPFGVADTLHVHGVTLTMPIYIPAIDWGVIAIILGSSLFVDASSRSGLFSWIAIRLTKLSGGDPWKLLIYYGLMTVFFSAVLNNVTAMIIVGSLTGVSLKKLKQEDKLLGFLMVEGLLTNIGGLLTLVSSVPNIIVGNAAGIPFMTFFLIASPYVVIATAVTIFAGRKIFDIQPLNNDDARREAAELVESFDENDGLESRAFFWSSVTLLVLFILVLASTSAIPGLRDLGMGFVALTFGFIALLRFKHSVDEFYKAIDWDLLFFFASLFIVINVMEHAQVLHLIGEGLNVIIDMNAQLGSALLLTAAAAFSSVTDNIPLAAMLSKALAAHPVVGANAGSPMWWAVIFGANLGGNLTPIGSASTVVAVTIMHRHRLNVSFSGFVKIALPFAIIQIILAVGYVVLYSVL